MAASTPATAAATTYSETFDHGIGMSRGVRAGASAAAKSVADKRGVHETVMAASDEWSERAGGTSGALWAAAIAAVANSLGNRESYDGLCVRLAQQGYVAAGQGDQFW